MQELKIDLSIPNNILRPIYLSCIVVAAFSIAISVLFDRVVTKDNIENASSFLSSSETRQVAGEVGQVKH